MFIMTAQEWVDKFTHDMESGWLKPDDFIAMEYWTYDDVRSFAEGDDYYGEVTDVVAREVWDKVTDKLARYDNVDNDVVNDEISSAFNKRMEGN